MKISLQQRQIELSVSEFASFGRYALSTSPSPTAAQQGQHWHEHIHQHSQKQHGPQLQCEHAIQGTLIHQGWSIQLSGRIDQIIQHPHYTQLREIKSTSHSLPTSESELQQRYPHYWQQLACYHRLWQQQHPSDTPLVCALHFVQSSSGQAQEIICENEELEQHLHQQLACLRSYLTQQSQRSQRLQHFCPQQVFSQYREGQKECIHTLNTFIQQKKHSLFQAPTGFGKTGVLLEVALQQLQQGHCQRILLLTSKKSGQTQIQAELDRIFPPDNPHALAHYNMRSQLEHPRLETPQHNTIPADLWPQLNQNQVCFADITRWAQKHQIEPYALSLARLRCCEIWIADYNYLFSPRSRHLFTQEAQLKPSQTLLIIDEAHNLPPRVQDNYAWQIDLPLIQELSQLYRWLSPSHPLLAVLKQWQDLLQDLSPKEEVFSPDELEHIRTLQLHTHQALLQLPPAPDNLATHPLSQLQHTRPLPPHSSPGLYWAPSDHTLRYDPLAAQPEIQDTLQDFAHTICSSATLAPTQNFLQQCGLDPNHTAILETDLSWKSDAYRIAIDTRPDTRSRQRSQYYELTAHTIGQLCQSSNQPVPIFFPSYQYARALLEYLRILYPLQRHLLQPQAASRQQNEQFLQDALLSSHGILLVLGGSFAESIDSLGGQVDSALIISPALPQVSFWRQQYQEHHYPQQNQAAFDFAYIQPGMRKVQQALGRLVRSPQQQVKVILHCQRFAQAEYQQYLPSYCHNATTLKTHQDLQHWLYGQ